MGQSTAPCSRESFALLHQGQLLCGRMQMPRELPALLFFPSSTLFRSSNYCLLRWNRWRVCVCVRCSREDAGMKVELPI
jgi:hypothetical protein